MRKRFFTPAGAGFRALAVLLLMPLSLCRADVNKMVVEAGKKATALVEIYDGNTLKGWATAFCIDKSGVFVTNNHVARTGAKDNKLTLVLDAGLRTQRSITATVLKSDADVDLAILRDHAGPYESLELSDPAGIRALTETTQVTVFGYPFGEALALRDNARPEASVTSSKIMALRHDSGELQLIQLDGSLNHGNSGGPVVDDRGRVIGIISAGIPGSAIAFAIPANRVGRLLLAARVTLTSGSSSGASAGFDEVLADDQSQAPDPADRATIPDDAARKAAQKVVHDLLAAQFADTTLKGKRALAAALLAQGAATTDDPAGCYELLSEACDVAVDLGDLDTAIKAAGELGRRYDINVPALKAGILIRLAPKLITPWDSALLAAHGLVTAQAMVHRDMYPDAQKLIPIIRAAATTSYSVQVQKQVRDKLAPVEAACAQYALAEPAITKLKATPNDPDANLAAGRFQCFARGNFDKGLPFLAKGSDAALKAAAVADLAGPSTGPACKAAGDAWWNQAARETKDAVAAEQCKVRSGYWYRLAVEQLSGLTKTLVEQRLASLPVPADTGTEASATAAPVDGVYRLNSDQLPPAFDATGTFSVSDAGLKPSDDKCLIITKATDFLSKDFVFDAGVNVPLKEDWIIVGLGDGTEKGSLRLVIRPDGRAGTRAFITLGDRLGKLVGDIRVAGPRVLRIERHGTAVTVAVGVDNAGKFEPDMSQTVADAKAAVDDLSEHQAHLFFAGKTNWTQVRLLTGNAARPAAVATAPMPPTPPVAVTPPAPGAGEPARPPSPAPAAVGHVTVISADYGSGQRIVSVAKLIQAEINADPFAPVAVGDWFGSDPAPNTRKTLTLTYRIGSNTGTISASEGEVVPLPPIPKDGVRIAGASVPFKIIASRYGVDNQWLDVTHTIREEVVDPSIPLKVRRMSDRDLHFGWRKWLLVYFEVDGRRFVQMASEEETMTLIPK